MAIDKKNILRVKRNIVNQKVSNLRDLNKNNYEL